MSDNSFSVEKPGKMLLEFAKARGERQYDWNNRQYFAMDVTEMGDMIANLSRGEGVQFYHDSSLGGNDSDGSFGGGGAGKGFRADLSPDGNVWFFSLTDRSKEKWLVPVSMGEFVVVRQIMQAAIPAFLGVDVYLNGGAEINDGDMSYAQGGMLLAIAVGGILAALTKVQMMRGAIAGIATWKAATHRLEKLAQSPRQGVIGWTNYENSCLCW